MNYLRYLSEYSRYPLEAHLVPYDFAVNLSFNSVDEYNSVATSVWSKSYDLQQGYCSRLKLSLGSSTGTGTYYLYNESADHDAATYPYLSLDYYSSGCGARCPPPNLIVNVCSAGSSADYTIQVNGGSGTSLLSYSPILTAVASGD